MYDVTYMNQINFRNGKHDKKFRVDGVLLDEDEPEVGDVTISSNTSDFKYF